MGDFIFSYIKAYLLFTAMGVVVHIMYMFLLGKVTVLGVLCCFALLFV